MRSFLVAILLLAGCAQPVAEEAPVEAALPAIHLHAEPSHHRVADGASVLSADDLQRFGWSEEEHVGTHAAAIHKGRAILAVAAAGPQQQGVHIFDVASGLDHLAFYDARMPVNGDRTIAMSDDGMTVFLGHERGPQPGVEAIDIRDPTAPKQVAFFSDPAGYGPHTIGAGFDGEQYVFLLSFGVTMLRYSDSGFEIVGKYAAADDLALLEGSSSSTGAQTFAFRSLYGHDMAFWVDPDTGTPYLAVAYAYDGVKLLDVTQMSAPLLVARWTPPSDTGHRHYVHSAAMTRDDNGRALLVVGSETFEEENQQIASPIWLLDVTETLASPDLAPKHLATWTNPDDAPAGNLQSSVHFFRIEEGRLVVSHYHEGVYWLGLQPVDRMLPVIAHVRPVADPPIRAPEGCCGSFDLEAIPMVFDVEAMGDRAFAIDIFQGVFEMKLD